MTVSKRLRLISSFFLICCIFISLFLINIPEDKYLAAFLCALDIVLWSCTFYLLVWWRRWKRPSPRFYILKNNTWHVICAHLQDKFNMNYFWLVNSLLWKAPQDGASVPVVSVWVKNFRLWVPWIESRIVYHMHLRGLCARGFPRADLCQKSLVQNSILSLTCMSESEQLTSSHFVISARTRTFWRVIGVAWNTLKSLCEIGSSQSAAGHRHRLNQFPLSPLEWFSLSTTVKDKHFIRPPIILHLETTTSIGMFVSILIGLDAKSSLCQRFFRDGLTSSFNKVLTDEALLGWKQEIQVMFCSWVTG